MIPKEYEKGRDGEWWSRVDANRGLLDKLHPECGKSVAGNSTLGNSLSTSHSLYIYRTYLQHSQDNTPEVVLMTVSLLYGLSYLAAAAAFIFVTLSLGQLHLELGLATFPLTLYFRLASGLLWLAELIEENSKIAKAIGIRLTYVRLILSTRLKDFVLKGFARPLFCSI